MADPRNIAVDIRTSMKETDGLNISVRTVRRRLTSFGLHGRCGVKKKLLITKKNRLTRLKFVREHL